MRFWLNLLIGLCVLFSILPLVGIIGLFLVLRYPWAPELICWGAVCELLYRVDHTLIGIHLFWLALAVTVVGSVLRTRFRSEAP